MFNFLTDIKRHLVISSTLLIGFTLSLITGCMLTPRPYDNIEYSYVINTSVQSTRAIHRCNDVDKTDFWKYYQELNTSSFTLDEFINNKGNSEYINESVDNLRDMVNDFSQKGKFTNQYCIHKLSNIQASSRIVSRVLGGSDKYNFCDKSIKDRFLVFKDSYDKKLITKEEFKELIEDLTRLEKIDTNTCDIYVRERLIEDFNMIKDYLPGIK